MQDYRIQQANVYTDFEGLNALKTQARTDKESALREVARQFESLFLAEMLKSMRKAGDVMAEGNYLNTNESQAYRDMFDNQISLSMAGNQGTGLADALVRQLSPRALNLRNSSCRPCCPWRNASPKTAALTYGLWWPRPRLKPVGANT